MTGHRPPVRAFREHLFLPIADTWPDDGGQLPDTVRGIQRGGIGKGDPSGKSPNVGLLAEELGVKRSTAFYRMQVAKELEDEPDLAEQVDRGDMDVAQALQEEGQESRRPTWQGRRQEINGHVGR
jgi:hypothetical protein